MVTIGKLATLTGVTPDTLRFYEREHLLVPDSKSEAGYRLYSQQTARRVHFIKHAQQCGFTLSEIKELLELKTQDAACCSEVRDVALQKKLQLESKIKALKAMSAALDVLIATCVDEDQPVNQCPILFALEGAVVPK